MDGLKKARTNKESALSNDLIVEYLCSIFETLTATTSAQSKEVLVQVQKNPLEKLFPIKIPYSRKFIQHSHTFS